MMVINHTKYSGLELINRLLLQWFFVRLTKAVEMRTQVTTCWLLLYWIVPTTGWSTPFIYVGKTRHLKLKNRN